MDKKKCAVSVAMTLGALALIATSVSTCVLYSKVKALEASPGNEETEDCVCREADGAGSGSRGVEDASPTGEAAVADSGSRGGEDASPTEKAPDPLEMRVIGCSATEAGRVEVLLEEDPDLEVLSNYLSFDPEPNGKPLVTCRRRWNWKVDRRVPVLTVEGDFQYRTNTVLRLRAGLPIANAASMTNRVVKPLAEDYVFTFKRADEPPRVAFADKGRYLPPTGARALALTTVNLPKVRAAIRRLPPANIVPMLALEERAYDKIYRSWDSGDCFAADLAGEPYETTVANANRLNTEERSYLTVTDTDSPAFTNGVFVIRVDNAADREGGGRWWSDSDSVWNRVVCVTDLGISARRVKSGILVWTSSLSRGTPVAGAQVEVYSTANVLVAKGVTSNEGLCLCESVAKGEPFAVVVSAADGSDRSFIALTDRMSVDETPVLQPEREAYLKPDESTAFIWTERGIYRHDERIFLQAILRNGTGEAPKPFPLELVLKSPKGNVLASRTVMPNEEGVLSDESFCVDADQPSGVWMFWLKTPGKDGTVLGKRTVKIEEFAPPQIRVRVQAAKDVKPQDFSFAVTAEHLYGGPAKDLASAGAVLFEDAPFAPAGWKGWSFGDPDRGLKPSFRELDGVALDEKGAASYAAPLWADSGKPKAAVRITAQGTVFEDGGRPAVARDTVIAHYYPYYIGSTLTDWVSRPQTGRAVVRLACVGPDGKRLTDEKKLEAKLERIDSVYTYRKNDEGWTTWDCEHVRVTVAEKLPVVVPADGLAAFALPTDLCGDYVVTVTDPVTDVSFSKTFYLSDWGDSEVRAPLSNPTAVTVKADKPFYRPGDVPKLVVKAPFAGTALMTVLRDDLVYAKSLTLTNATSEVELAPCEAAWAPNVEVRFSVVKAVKPGEKGFTTRAQGGATIVVRRSENEIPVSVKSVLAPAADGADAGSAVTATVSAPGATHAVVTLVDEGINILTDEKTPDPLGFFAKPRICFYPDAAFYDLYHLLLPVLGEDELHAGGVKTGGDGDAGLLGRVSPVPTRRFKPLALWQKDVPVADGKAVVTFALPEFVGEVRVTAVAWSDKATGSASVQQKVCPNLVMQPDAPRFVAPGDTFRVTLPLANRSETDGEVAYRIADATGKTIGEGKVSLGKGDSTVIKCEATAPAQPGPYLLDYTAEGLGERHAKTLEIPVRPAVAWQEASGVVSLGIGESWTFPRAGSPEKPFKVDYHVSGSRIGELRSAMEWLAEYPHGCLEQTASRIFPLIAGDGVLAGCSSVKAVNRLNYVRAGVARVESMVRERDFTMWPDCNDAPWDREVSLYAAHFLIEAERSGVTLGINPRHRVMGFLERWALSSTNSVSAYACHTLALAGRPAKDRMLRLYDGRAQLDLLSRARLARAFVATADRTRAQELMKNADAPASVREAAFLMLAILELDPNDARLPRLVNYLMKNRPAARLCWGTTGDNAHALLALAAYYKAHPVPDGKPEVRTVGDALVNAGQVPAFVTWRTLSLPDPSAVKAESRGLSVKREFLTAKGEPYDLAKASCGDLVIVRLTLSTDVERDLNDLVIEDLFPGAFEPVHGGIDLNTVAWIPGKDRHDWWVMRSDARDDRMLVFSKKFHLKANEEVAYHYQVRVVSAGAYALPGVAVDAMYQPGLRARTGADRLVVRD